MCKLLVAFGTRHRTEADGRCGPWYEESAQTAGHLAHASLWR